MKVAKVHFIQVFSWFSQKNNLQEYILASWWQPSWIFQFQPLPAIAELRRLINT